MCMYNQMFIAGVKLWPQHYRPKYILLTWVLVTLIIDFGELILITTTMYMFIGEIQLFQHIPGA